MKFVRLILDINYGNYSYKDASNMDMYLIGTFLAADVRCHPCSSFKEWALNDAETITGGNATALEKENDDVYLCDGTEPMTDEIRANGFKIPRVQFIQLLDDWKEKVCKIKPKEVIIKHDGGQFVVEIS